MAHGAADELLNLDYHALDEDGNDLVDKVEFMLGARDILDVPGKEDRRQVYSLAERLFEACDLNRDEVLNHLEIEYAQYLADVAARVSRRGGDRVSLYNYALSGDGGSALAANLDTDGDGSVDEMEFWDGMVRDLHISGWAIVDFEEPEVRRWMRATFATADLDNDGVLRAEEVQFADFLIFKREAKLHGIAWLEYLDRDWDGRVTWHELVTSTIANLGMHRPGGATSFIHMVRDGFRDADLDADGALDLAEMTRLARHKLKESMDRSNVET